MLVPITCRAATTAVSSRPRYCRARCAAAAAAPRTGSRSLRSPVLAGRESTPPRPSAGRPRFSPKGCGIEVLAVFPQKPPPMPDRRQAPSGSPWVRQSPAWPTPPLPGNRWASGAQLHDLEALLAVVSASRRRVQVCRPTPSHRSHVSGMQPKWARGGPGHVRYAWLPIAAIGPDRATAAPGGRHRLPVRLHWINLLAHH